MITIEQHAHLIGPLCAYWFSTGPMHPEDPGVCSHDSCAAIADGCAGCSVAGEPAPELCVIDGSPIDPASRLCLLSCQDADREQYLAEGCEPWHDCPKEAFLDDPITRAYGVGSEMLHLISCAVCDAREGGE